MKNFFLSFLFTMCFVTQGFAFTDVPSSHKNSEAITSFAELGIVQGYADNTFRPDALVNRAEALKIILKGSGIDEAGSFGNGEFPDIDENEWYAPFVVKSKNLGIVSGDPSGKFFPGRTINLAENLKIVLLANGVNISLHSLKEQPYEDVPASEWHAPYFAYARDNALLDEKSYEKVFPAKEMTRGEMVEIMFRLRKVLENEHRTLSYASFYADMLHGSLTASSEVYDKNLFTGAHRTFPFGSRVEVTNLNTQKSVIVRINDRGPSVAGREIDLSKIAFESISPLSKGIIPVSLRLLEEDSAEFDAYEILDDCTVLKTEDPYPKDFFFHASENQKITLYNELPAEVFPYEVRDISGKVEDASVTEVTAFLKDEEGGTKVFSSPVVSGNFMIQVFFGEKGEKQLSLVQGNSGTNYMAHITVIDPECSPFLPSIDTNQDVKNVRFAIEKNEVILRWDIPETSLSRVLFSQGGIKKEFYFAQGKKGFKLPLAEFSEFSQGDFSLKIEVANSEDGSFFTRNSSFSEGSPYNFSAVSHHFSIVDDSKIEISFVPMNYVIGSEITLSGRTKTEILSDLAIITSHGSYDSVKISGGNTLSNEKSSSYYPVNTQFTVSYKPEIHGTYILEINSIEGYAVLNIPVYEIGKIPLIPDYQDMRSYRILSQEGEISLSQGAQTALQLVNRERKSAQQKNIELSTELSLLAQNRAENMALRGVISHWDENGKTINDIRVDFAVKTVIGENLAEEQDILSAHEGLMRSAIHRKNILDPYWERVGFGFAKAKSGNIIMVQAFSSFPLEQNNVPKLREEMLQMINSKREILYVPSASLDSLSQNWTLLMVQDDFFDFTSPDSQTLSESIRQAGVVKTVGTFLVGNDSWHQILSTVMENSEIFESRWKRIGIGIAQDTDGIIKVTLLFSE